MKPGVMELIREDDYPQLKVTEQMLRDAAESYDPKLHEAPLVIGHGDERDGNDYRSKTGEPAHGWFKRLWVEGKTLFGEPAQISDFIKEGFNQGKWKKWSVEIYPKFKQTGKPYLKAVAMLGAGVPAVKGLRQTVFNDENGDSIAIECNDQEEEMTKEELEQQHESLFKKITNFFKENKKEFAEEEDLDLKSILDNASNADIEEAISEILDHPRSMEVLAKLEKEAEAAQMSERENDKNWKFREAEIKKGISSWIEAQIKAGRLSPKVKDAGLHNFMEMIAFNDDVDATMKFSEAGKEMTPLAFFQSIIEENAVPFSGEVAPNSSDEETKPKAKLIPVKFGEKDESGRKIDLVNLDLAESAAQIAKDEKIPFAEAMIKAAKQAK